MYGGVREMLRIENKIANISLEVLCLLFWLPDLQEICADGEDKMMEGKNWKKIEII